MDYHILGRRIREKRKLLHISQSQFAEKLGLSEPYIGMIERGERVPSLETFIQISDGLGATADELLYGIAENSAIGRLREYEAKMTKLSDKEKESFFQINDAFFRMKE